MGCIRVESKSKIILPIDLVQALYISLVPKISAGAKGLARAGRGRGRRKEEEKKERKTESSPEEQVVQNAKGNSHVTERIDPFRIFFLLRSVSCFPSPMSTNMPGPVMLD